MHTLKWLIENAVENQTQINGRWVPARPINWKYRSLKEKLRDAWMVFIGRADCFTWPEGQ